MGAIAPIPHLDPSIIAAMKSILEKTVRGLASEGHPYRGLLYGGFMLTDDGPKVLEFNCRFGDPEAQVILPLIASDLYQHMVDCAKGQLRPESLKCREGTLAATVIAASAGYPGPTPVLPLPIKGLERAAGLKGE